MIKSFKIILLLFLLISISCENEPQEFIPDVSLISPEYSVIRYEDQMMKKSVNALDDEFPAFSETFFKHIIPVKREENYQAAFDTIKANKEFISLLDTTKVIFNDFDKVNADLNQAFKYLIHYLPEIDVPDIYTFISGFAYQRFIREDEQGNNIIGLGLDMFLGETFPYGSISPDNPAFSNYLTRTFNKDHLSKKIIELLINDYLPTPSKNQMLDQMIYNGKKLYLINKIIPEKSDTIVMEYTADQWDWIQENEIEIWAFFLKEELFYETNSQKINKYLNPSPHSPGMPPNAPGRTANYIGWKIVDAYMKRYSETTIAELITLNDAQDFLQKSKYKPRK